MRNAGGASSPATMVASAGLRPNRLRRAATCSLSVWSSRRAASTLWTSLPTTLSFSSRMASSFHWSAASPIRRLASTFLRAAPTPWKAARIWPRSPASMAPSTVAAAACTLRSWAWTLAGVSSLAAVGVPLPPGAIMLGLATI